MSLFRILILSAIVTVSAAGGDRVVDGVLHFSFQPPSDFISYPQGKTKETILHCFIKHGDSEESPKTVFQLEVMNGTFPISQRLKESELPKIQGMTFTLSEVVWKKMTLDRVRQSVVAPSGVTLVSYCCQLPTSPRAIQLSVVGPLDREKEISDALARVVTSFEGRINQEK